MVPPRRILLATDAWPPQVNGVVRTLTTTVEHLRAGEHTIEVIAPADFATLPAPFYPEIRLAVTLPATIDRRVSMFRPDHIHIATEGPIGWRVRQFCQARRWAFTTAYHTRFPEYLQTLVQVPPVVTYRLVRWFHNAAAAMMVATPSLEQELQARGFRPPLRRWSRGVDLRVFRPGSRDGWEFPRPILLYAGRVSAEKNLAAFLQLDVPGTKVIVGDGPARAELARRFPQAKFLGYQKGEALAACYARADLFVFPSCTDTFGLVLVEALACGTPVAAFPVTGPIDIITRPELGALDSDLSQAIVTALRTGNRDDCAAGGATYSWENATRQFLANLVPVRGPTTPAAAGGEAR